MTPPRNGILGWLSRNPQLAVLIGLVLGVVSVVVSFVFGLIPLKARQLSWYVPPIRSTIVRSGKSSDLVVLYRAQPVKGDVSTAQIGIWNDGRESIKPEHVLEPIVVMTNPRVPILEAKIQYIARQ